MSFKNIIVTMLCLWATISFGQNSTGSVKDKNNMGVPSATIEVLNTAKFTTTDKDGNFSLELPLGNYQLRIRALGYSTKIEQVLLSETGAVLAIVLQEQLNELDEVVITGLKGQEQLVRESPMSITALTATTIRNTPATTIDELLRAVPGVQLPLLNSQANFPANPSISLRGLGIGDGATRTLVLVDGIPANGAFFKNVFWSRTPQQHIDRIEVIRGANSSSHGSYAMGGLLNIVASPISTEPQLNLDLRGGSQGTYQGNVYASIPISEKIRTSLDVNYFSTEGYQLLNKADKGAIDQKFDAENYGIRSKTEFLLKDDLTANIGFNYFNDDRNAGTKLGISSTEIFDVDAQVKKYWKNNSHLTFTLFYSDEQFENDGTSLVDRDSRDAEFVSNRHDTPSDNVGGSIVYSKRINDTFKELTFGADVNRISGKDDADIFLSDGSFALRRIGEGTQFSTGVFSKVRYAPIEKLEIQPTIRFDYFNASNGSLTENNVVTNFNENSFESFNPRLDVRYQALSALDLKGSFYTGFRAPTLAELYRTFGTTTFIGRANPQLTQEKLVGGEFSVVYTKGRYNGQVTAFTNTVEDLVSQVVVGFSPFTLQNENIGEIRSRGVEFSNTIQATKHLSMNLSYVYSDSKVIEKEEDEEIIGNKVEGVPDHFFSFTVGYTQPKGFNFLLRGRYLDDQFQDISNEILLPSHFILDASGSYIFSKKLTVYVTGENILDEDYVASGFGSVERRGMPIQVLGGVRLNIL